MYKEGSKAGAVAFVAELAGGLFGHSDGAVMVETPGAGDVDVTADRGCPHPVSVGPRGVNVDMLIVTDCPLCVNALLTFLVCAAGQEASAQGGKG